MKTLYLSKNDHHLDSAQRDAFLGHPITLVNQGTLKPDLPDRAVDKAMYDCISMGARIELPPL